MGDQELMQMALDMLEDINQCSLPPTGVPLPAEIDHVMEALRARLAEPEVGVCCQEFDKCLRSCTPRGQWIAHQAAQRDWQGLTEDDALQLLPVMPYEYDVDVEMILKFAEAIETKLKENNNG